MFFVNSVLESLNLVVMELNRMKGSRICESELYVCLVCVEFNVETHFLLLLQAGFSSG